MIPPDETRSVQRRLLLVDDNRLILRVVSDFFKQREWSVDSAQSVDAARAVLETSVPDAIVSDILMPGADGWTLFDEVRRRKETSAVPFVFLTTQSELPQRLRGFQSGADDYLTKPFEVEELHARVTRLVERGRMFRAAAAAADDSLLSGSLTHLAIADLLQILALNGKDATVRLDREGASGRIDCVGGRIVDARTGSVSGTKALYRMLGWTDATFRVLPISDAPPETTIGSSTATVLMDGLVALDEWARWGDMLPAPETRIELAKDARGKLVGQPLKPAEFDLLARSKKGTTVARAIEDSPHPDAHIAEAICTMIARGVVRATPGAGSTV